MNKKELLDYACKLYLDIDSEGIISFKTALNYSIDKSYFDRNDALIIVFKLLNLISYRKIRSYQDLISCEYKLTDKVKRINNMRDISKSKELKDNLFNSTYLNERKIVYNYLISLIKENEYDIPNYYNLIREFTGLSDYTLIKNEKDFISNSSTKKSKTKDISLDRFNKNDLCFILDKNPELTFEKEKILKKSIINDFKKYSLDVKLLNNLSKTEIKKCLNDAKSNKTPYNKRPEKIDINQIQDSTQKNQEKVEKINEPKIERQENSNESIKKQKEINQKSLSDKKAKILEKKKKELDLLFNEIDKLNKEPLEKLPSLKNQFDYINRKIQKLKINHKYSYMNRLFIFNERYKNIDKIQELVFIKNQFSSYNPYKKIQNQLFNKNKYISYDIRKYVLEKYEKIYNVIRKENKYPNKYWNDLIKPIPYIYEFKKIYEDLLEYPNINKKDENNSILVHNQNFINHEIKINESFFDDITDIHKKLAIVIDEYNTKVIAGAGTGKTFTIQKKVKYLIEKRGISPDKILCLCYNNKSADELDKRVNKGLDEDNQVEACTFHEFSRRIDTNCGGHKSTNRYLLNDVIYDYMRRIIDDDKKMSQLFEYFSFYLTPPDKEQFDSYSELKEYQNARDLSTLKKKFHEQDNEKYTMKGEEVKSLEELIIANYLFSHEIDYKYEDQFPDNYYAEFIRRNFLWSGKYLSMHKINEKPNERIVNNFIEWESSRKEYQPDFYLPEYDIYLEHFGVDRNNNVSKFSGISKQKYEKEMYSKINWHKMYGTTLITTYSYYRMEGTLIENLERLLKENGVKIGQIDKKELLNLILLNDKIRDYKNFRKLIKSFINIFEAKHLNKKDFSKFKKSTKLIKDGYLRKRQELFLNIVEEVYDMYFKRNHSNIIDHNREITNAYELIKNKKFDKKYDYILVDEYQDINYARYLLLKELQIATNAKLFVVGDDWQSIYSFNGSDIKLFIDFDEYFDSPELIKIGENRRNCQKINDITKNFIMNYNEGQEDKELKYYKIESNPNLEPIKIVKYPNNKKVSKILTLDAIFQHITENNPKKQLDILLLGRMNDDIDDFIGNSLFIAKDYEKYKKVFYAENPSLNIDFMSIHKSKGLEYDEVIILNLKDEIAGFPSQIDDDPILSLIKTSDENDFAEERRLFYVALTRTKNNVYLLTPPSKVSRFISELKKDNKIKTLKFEIEDEMIDKLFEDNEFFKRLEYFDTKIKCPQCGEGYVSITLNHYNHEGKETKYIECSKKCGYRGGPYFSSLKYMNLIEKCPSCDGMLIRHDNILKCSKNWVGNCPETKELNFDKEEMEDDDF